MPSLPFNVGTFRRGLSSSAAAANSSISSSSSGAMLVATHKAEMRAWLVAKRERRKLEKTSDAPPAIEAQKLYENLQKNNPRFHLLSPNEAYLIRAVCARGCHKHLFEWCLDPCGRPYPPAFRVEAQKALWRACSLLNVDGAALLGLPAATLKAANDRMDVVPMTSSRADAETARAALAATISDRMGQMDEMVAAWRAERRELKRQKRGVLRY